MLRASIGALPCSAMFSIVAVVQRALVLRLAESFGGYTKLIDEEDVPLLFIDVCRQTLVPDDPSAPWLRVRSLVNKSDTADNL